MPESERRLTGLYFLAIHFSPTFLNTGITNETFQQSGKQDIFVHILKSHMTLLIDLGATEILCSFRLVLEGYTGKEILESSRL